MFEQFNNWWEGITEREQQLTLASAAIVFVAALYFLIWKPLANDLADQRQKLEQAEQTLSWVEKNTSKLLVEGVGNNKRSSRKQNLSQLVNRTAKQSAISISRIQNGDDEVDVWINRVEFNQFIKWTTQLKNQHKVRINNVDLSKDKEQGVIRVSRLSLSY